MFKKITLTTAIIMAIGLLNNATHAQNVGIGQNSPASKLDLKGNLTVGSTYSGTAAPANGAIIQGNVGIGTTLPAQALEIGATNGTIRVDGLKSGNSYNTSATSSSNLLFVNSSTGDLSALSNGSNGQVMTLNGSGVPTWSTPSATGLSGIVPVSNGGTGLNTFGGVNTLLYTSVANTLSSITTANNGVLITNGTGVPSIGTTLPSAVQSNITSLGIITSGTWNGTAIGVAYGGTGITSYTAGALLDASSSSAMGQIADVTAGSYLRSAGSGNVPVWSTMTLPNAATTGDMLYATGSNAIGNLSDVATGNVLISGGVGAMPTYGKVALASAVSGTLPVANGGTGVTSLTTNGILYGGSAIGATAAGSQGQILTVNSSGNPSWTTATFPATTVANQLLYSSSANTVAGLAVGTSGQVLTTNGSGALAWATPTSGTVTSVGLSMPSIFTVSNSPVTSSGTLTAALNTQSANTVFAGPSSGSAVAPTFRALVNADFPASGVTAGTYNNITVNAQGIATSGSNVSYLTSAVTSVGLSLPSIFTVTNSPVTSTGTLTGTLASETANTFFAAPNGSAGAPAFRAIVAADIPTLNQNTTGTAANVTGTVAVANGGTGLTSYTAGSLLDASSSSAVGQIADVTAGSYLRSAGSGNAPVWSTMTLPNAATTGDILYASGTNAIGNLSDVATGNVLLSGGTSTAPSWGKVALASAVSGTLPVGNGGTGVTSFGGTNTLLYTSSANTLSSLTTVNNSVLTTSSTGVPTWLAAGTNGQVLTMVSGAPAWATAAAASGWAITGNASTTPGTNYIGTTDGNALVFKTDGFEGMRITNGGGSASGNVVIGSGEASGTVAGGTLRAPNSSGTNVRGANLTITSGNGTGSAGSGDIVLETALPGSSGTTANTMAEAMRIDSAGNVGFGGEHPAAQVDINGNLAMRNYVITGASGTSYTLNPNGYSFVEVQSTSGFTLKNITAGVNGQVLIVWNSTANMDLTTGGNITSYSSNNGSTVIAAATFIYSSTHSAWVMVSAQ